MNAQDQLQTHQAGVLYPEDTVVRESAVQVVRRIADKVQGRAHEAVYGATSEDEQRDRMQAALVYAVDALRGIETALSLGRGGIVNYDDTTSLYFRGILEGAVIDRDDRFSTHT